MPQNDPRASISDIPRPLPADILFYQNSSMLDTIFVNKSKKKPAWITITAGSQTILYSVSSAGKLTAAATIEWAAKGNNSKKPEVTVKINGETFPADKFGRPSGGFYGSTSARHFTIGELNCQWACTTLKTTQDGWAAFTSQVSQVLQWDCTAEAPGSPPSPSLHTSPTSKLFTFFKTSPPEKQRLLLASYLDGASKKQSQGLTIYPEGVPYTALLLISAIFSNAEGGFWRKQQSKASVAEIEAMLSGDLGGNLPTYTSVRDTHSARIDLHLSVATHPPSRWTHQRPRSNVPATPPDDFPPEYASTY